MNPSRQFAAELLHRLAFDPESCPAIRLTGHYGADGHGGPGHRDEPADECGTRLGDMCFRGAFVHIDGAIYQVDRYEPSTHTWTAHWPD